MKQLILALTLAAAAAASGDVKIGTVDMMTLVKSHPSYESNKTTLQSTEKDYQDVVDGYKAEIEKIQTEGRKLAEDLKNPMLAATAKTKIEADLMKIQERYVAKQQQLQKTAMQNQQKLSELEATLLKAQAKDIKERIAQFAEKNGYDMVLDASAALYAKESFDVTDGVLKLMGVDPKPARAKEQNEGK